MPQGARSAGKPTFPYPRLHGAFEPSGVGWFNFALFRQRSHIQRVECRHAVRSLDSPWQSNGGRAEARASRAAGAGSRYRWHSGGHVKVSPTDPYLAFTDIATRAARLCDAQDSAVVQLADGNSLELEIGSQHK